MFCPNSKRRSSPFRPNSRPSRDIHSRRETALQKRVSTDIQGFPRRKPPRGSHIPRPNVYKNNLRQTTYLNPGSGTVRIGTGSERHPVENVTDANVARRQINAMERPTSSIQERSAIPKMEDPCRAPIRWNWKKPCRWPSTMRAPDLTEPCPRTTMTCDRKRIPSGSREKRQRCGWF